MRAWLSPVQPPDLDVLDDLQGAGAERIVDALARGGDRLEPKESPRVDVLIELLDRERFGEVTLVVLIEPREALRVVVAGQQDIHSTTIPPGRVVGPGVRQVRP